MNSSNLTLRGSLAVVTGGTKGIGRGITLALAEAGADLAVVSRSPDTDLEQRIQALGRRFVHLAADLSRREETRELVPEVIRKLGEPDILVNNAGICLRKPALEFSEADWDQSLEINLSAPFILSRAAARGMQGKKRGKIINVASVLSFQGGINIPAYAASKHGIAGLTKSMGNDLAPLGINVNAIAPGYFKTEFTEAIQNDRQRAESIMARTPAGRWGDPQQDIGGLAVFLASSASDFVNGAILPVDGGWLAR